MPARATFASGTAASSLEQTRVPREGRLALVDEVVRCRRVERKPVDRRAELPFRGLRIDALREPVEGDTVFIQCVRTAHDVAQELAAAEIAHVAHVGVGDKQHGLLVGNLLQPLDVSARRIDDRKRRPIATMQMFEIRAQRGGAEQGWKPNRRDERGCGMSIDCVLQRDVERVKVTQQQAVHALIEFAVQQLAHDAAMLGDAV